MILLSRDQRLVVVCREVEAAVFAIAEMLEHRRHEFHGLVDPAFVKGSFVQGYQGIGQVGVVVQVGVETGATAAPAVKQPSRLRGGSMQEKLGGPPRPPRRTRDSCNTRPPRARSRSSGRSS